MFPCGFSLWPPADPLAGRAVQKCRAYVAIVKYGNYRNTVRAQKALSWRHRGHARGPYTQVAWHLVTTLACTELADLLAHGSIMRHTEAPSCHIYITAGPLY